VSRQLFLYHPGVFFCRPPFDSKMANVFFLSIIFPVDLRTVRRGSDRPLSPAKFFSYLPVLSIDRFSLVVWATPERFSAQSSLPEHIFVSVSFTSDSSEPALA